jgi:hypothetical protein
MYVSNSIDGGQCAAQDYSEVENGRSGHGERRRKRNRFVCNKHRFAHEALNLSLARLWGSLGGHLDV